MKIKKYKNHPPLHPHVPALRGLQQLVVSLPIFVFQLGKALKVHLDIAELLFSFERWLPVPTHHLLQGVFTLQRQVLVFQSIDYGKPCSKLEPATNSLIPLS